MKKDQLIALAIVTLFVVFLTYLFFFSNKGKTEQIKEGDELAGTPQPSVIILKDAMKEIKPPAMQIDKTKSYTAVVKTTEGTMKIQLNAKETPVTVNNFVALSKSKFYNNTIFHRVMSGFMIQGGDPQGTGMGGPGYRFDDEEFNGEYERGTIAMANAGPNTNGSQFFIMHKDYKLPKDYVIFGKVTEGLDVVDKIATAPVKESQSGEKSAPVTPIKIESVEIIEK